jgi:hypothetical protein
VNGYVAEQRKVLKKYVVYKSKHGRIYVFVNLNYFKYLALQGIHIFAILCDNEYTSEKARIWKYNKSDAGCISL